MGGVWEGFGRRGWGVRRGFGEGEGDARKKATPKTAPKTPPKLQLGPKPPKAPAPTELRRQPRAAGAGVEHGLRGGEGLGDDHNQGGLGVEALRRRSICGLFFGGSGFEVGFPGWSRTVLPTAGDVQQAKQHQRALLDASPSPKSQPPPPKKLNAHCKSQSRPFPPPPDLQRARHVDWVDVGEEPQLAAAAGGHRARLSPARTAAAAAAAAAGL